MSDTTSPPVRLLHPDIRVTLYKLVRRQTTDGSIPVASRYTESDRVMDLTPFLSDLAGTIHTTKSTRSPAGAFAMTFSDAPYGEAAAATMESLYGLVEPMDGIEIRASHNHGHVHRTPPILMRGFVSSISRSQSVDGRGNPMRTITIEGHDYGKIWQMLQVLYRPFNVMGEALLSNFRLFERFGGEIANQLGRDLVAGVIDRIINPHLAGMLPEDWPMPRTIGTDLSVPDGMTSVTGSQNYEGAIYNLLAHFCDVTNGFNELYIEDRPDSVVAVYRPNPAIDLAGAPIQPPSGNPEYRPQRFSIAATDIIAMDLARTDQDVANYFWVDDARHELVLPLPQQFAAANSSDRATVFMESHPNNLPSIYGMRPMVVATQMGASDTFQSGRNAEQDAQRQTDAIGWLHRRRAILALTNRDNALLEHGTIRIAGNENIRAGTFVEIGRGALAAPYYVAAITHDWHAFKGFFSTLHVERGMGFARRIQSAGTVAPYLLELGANAADNPAPAGTAIPVSQAGAAGTPDAGNTPATEPTPPPSTAQQRPAAAPPPPAPAPGTGMQSPYQPGQTLTPTYTTPPPPAGRNGGPIADWGSSTGFRNADGSERR